MAGNCAKSLHVLRNDIYQIAKSLANNQNYERKKVYSTPERVCLRLIVSLSISVEFMRYTDSPEWLLCKLIFSVFFVIYLAISNELMIAVRITCARDEVLFFPIFAAAITKTNFNVFFLFISQLSIVTAVLLVYLSSKWRSFSHMFTIAINMYCSSSATATTATTTMVDISNSAPCNAYCVWRCPSIFSYSPSIEMTSERESAQNHSEKYKCYVDERKTKKLSMT